MSIKNYLSNKMNIKTQSTYALKDMVIALSSLGVLITDEENKRLQLAKKELAKRDLILKQHEKIKLILR